MKSIPAAVTRHSDMRRPVLFGLLVAALVAIAPTLHDKSVPIWVLGVLAFLAVCAVGGYTDNWTWTGIGPYVKHEGEAQPGKTLWDVLQLVIIPAVLSLGVIWINDTQTAADKSKADTQAKIDKSTAESKAQDAVLSGYLSQISDLMLNHKLGFQPTPSKPNDGGVSVIARARTLTVLLRLDPIRRSLVVRFLSEAKLIPYVDLSIINLQGVSLQGINLTCASPPGQRHACADLRWAWLNKKANLSFTDLAYADLSNAHLNSTILKNADLDYAALAYADLKNADLDHASLKYANFVCDSLATAAEQSSAPHSNACASGSSWLSGANLSNADLDHANMKNADLDGANLGGAGWNHTTCPDGTNSATNHTVPQSCTGHLTADVR